MRQVGTLFPREDPVEWVYLLWIASLGLLCAFSLHIPSCLKLFRIILLLLETDCSYAVIRRIRACSKALKLRSIGIHPHRGGFSRVCHRRDRQPSVGSNYAREHARHP